MKKTYYANIEYNKLKRRNAVLLSVILFMALLSMAAMFASQGQYLFAIIFGFILILPIVTVPSAYKNFPVDGREIVAIENNLIKVNNKEFKVKDVLKLNVIITLPSTKNDVKDRQILENLKKEYPTEDCYGTFDIVYIDSKGKRQVEYSTIDLAISALKDAVSIGVKNYSLKYTIKKNVVLNECDLKKEPVNDEDKLEKVSQKNRKRQLL